MKGNGVLIHGKTRMNLTKIILNIRSLSPKLMYTEVMTFPIFLRKKEINYTSYHGLFFKNS